MHSTNPPSAAVAACRKRKYNILRRSILHEEEHGNLGPDVEIPFRGVSYVAQTRTYRSFVKLGNRTLIVGNYQNIIEAAMKHDIFVRENSLNSPTNWSDDGSWNGAAIAEAPSEQQDEVVSGPPAHVSPVLFDKRKNESMSLIGDAHNVNSLSIKTHAYKKRKKKMSSSKHSGVLADNAARPMRPDTIYFHCNLWSNIRYNGLPYPCYLPSKMSDDLIYIGNVDAVGSCAVHCASSMLRQYGPKGSRVGKRRWLLSWDQLAGKGRGALVGSETFRTSRAWSSILRPDESTNDVTQHFAFATTAAVLKAVWRRHVVRTFSGDDEGEFDRMKSRSKTMIEEMRQLRSYATSVSLYALRDLIVTDATMCGVFEAQTANTPLLLPPQLLAFRVATFVKTHLKSILLILEESVVACCGGLAENAVSEGEETSRKIIKEAQKREARILSRLALDLPRIQTKFSSVGSSLLPASPEGKDPLLPSCPSLLQSSKGCKSKLMRVEMAVRLRAWRVIVLMRSQAHDFARETRCDAKMEHDFAANAPDLALLVSEILFVAARAVVQKRCSIFRWIEAMYLMRRLRRLQEIERSVLDQRTAIVTACICCGEIATGGECCRQCSHCSMTFHSECVSYEDSECPICRSNMIFRRSCETRSTENGYQDCLVARRDYLSPCFRPWNTTERTFGKSTLRCIVGSQQVRHEIAPSYRRYAAMLRLHMFVDLSPLRRERYTFFPIRSDAIEAAERFTDNSLQIQLLLLAASSSSSSTCSKDVVHVLDGDNDDDRGRTDKCVASLLPSYASPVKRTHDNSTNRIVVPRRIALVAPRRSITTSREPLCPLCAVMNRGKKRTKENDTRRRRLRCAKCKQIGGLDIGSPHFAGQEKDDGRVEKRNIVPFDVSSGQETKRVTFGGRRSALKSLLGDFISYVAESIHAPCVCVDWKMKPSPCLCSRKEQFSTRHTLCCVSKSRHVSEAHECNRFCQCSAVTVDGGNCGLRSSQSGVGADLEVFWTGRRRRWGVRSHENITKHSYICVYVGEIVPMQCKCATGCSHANCIHVSSGCAKCAKSSIRERRSQQYVWELADTRNRNKTPKFAIDARRYRNVAAFINHTCTQANVEARYVWSDHLDNALPRVVFYAKRTIKAGDELLVHYGFKLDNCACATCSPVIENLTIEEKRRQVREVALRTVGESIGHRVKRSATEAYRFRVEIRRDEEHWEFLLRDSIRDLVDYVRRDSDMLQVIREATDHFDAVLSSYKINTTSTVTHGGMRGPSMIEKRRRVRDACLRVLCKSSKYRVDWTFRRKLKRGRYGDAGSKQFRLLAKSGSELLGDDDDEKDAVEMYTLVARSVPELVDLVCRNEEDTRAVCKETEFFDEVRTYLCGESSNESESSEEENEDRVTIPGKRRQVRDVILRILDGNDEHRVERDDISDGCQKFRLFRYRWNAHGEKTWRLVARSLPELINYVLRFNLITDTVRMSTDYFDDVRESFQQKAPKLSSEFVRATRAKISKVTDVKIKSENTAVPNVWSRFRRDVIKVLVDRCNHTVRYNGNHWYLYRKKTTTGKLVRVARSAPELANYVGSLHDVNLIRDLRRRVENLDELVRIARAKNKVARALARTAPASGCP